MTHLVIAPEQGGLGASEMELGHQELSPVKTTLVAGHSPGFSDTE